MRTNPFVSNLLILSICAGLMACEDSDVTDAEFSGTGALQKMGFVHFGIDSSLIGTSNEERRALLEHNRKVVQELELALADVSASDWQKADHRVRSLLEGIETHDSARKRIEQLASAAMLRVWLLPQRGQSRASSEEIQAAAAHYVNVLVHRQSPEAELIADGIEVVGDYWSESQRTAVASAAADAARAYVEQADTCIDCATHSPVMTRVAPADRFLIETERAIDRLATLASN